MLEYEKDKENTERNVNFFGDEFIKNHPNLNYLYEKKSFPLSSSISFLEVKEKKTIRIEIDWPNIEDLSHLFENCEFLFSLSIRYPLNVKNTSYMFCNCPLLKNIWGIFTLDTSNVIDMSYMFAGCSNLEEISHISNWDTRNVKNMRFIFFGCCFSSSFRSQMEYK